MKACLFRLNMSTISTEFDKVIRLERSQLLPNYAPKNVWKIGKISGECQMKAVRTFIARSEKKNINLCLQKNGSYYANFFFPFIWGMLIARWKTNLITLKVFFMHESMPIVTLLIEFTRGKKKVSADRFSNVWYSTCTSGCFVSS